MLLISCCICEVIYIVSMCGMKYTHGHKRVVLEIDSGALNSVFVSSCIYDRTREVTDSLNVLGQDMLQVDAVLNIMVSSCCTALH
jgi:hypothetical protein